MLAPFIREPLLQAALVIVAVVAAYSAIYLSQRVWLFTLGYAGSVGAVALFTLSESPLWRFAGWEGVSAIAWTLIAFGRDATNRSLEAALVGFMINRLGDAFWVAALFHPDWNWGFVIGGWIKAALFPATFWLIQAMYAPIPVSALLHSALLVALGVYGPIQNPDWIQGLSDLQGVAEAAALGAAVGAFLSRIPKAALAWTTAAHLALVAAQWGHPTQAQISLLHHAYLKAALFLLLGAVQKRLSWTRWTGGLWLISAGFLEAITPSRQGLLGVVAEALTALVLGRLLRAYPFRKGPPSIYLLFPAVLFGTAFWQSPIALFRHWTSFTNLVILIIGTLMPWPRQTYRLDQVFMGVIRRIEGGWAWAAQTTSHIEQALLSASDRGFRRFLGAARFLALREVRLIDFFWQPLLRRFRLMLSTWIRNSLSEPTFQDNLRWGFVVTLFFFVLWHYFS